MTTPEGVPSLVGLAAARVALPGANLGPATVWVDRHTGLVDAVEPGRPQRPCGGPAATGTAPGPLVDLGDRILAPGFVDVHVHGAAGAQVNGDSPEEVARAVAAVAGFHAAHGTTALLATTVTDTPGRLAATVAGVARAARSARTGGARVLGCHLEGPFVAAGRAGAQDPSQVRRPDRAELARLLELGAGTVRLVTLAPELPGADGLIADCLAAGAAVALGHTDADYDTARRAFAAGATHVTHLWNAMAPLHHRRPGLVGAALADDAVTVEIVCDLHHVHPAVVALVAKAAPGRTVLVTDAIGATGATTGRAALGAVPVEVEGGRATLAGDPGVLAGSVLTMEAAVENASGTAGLPLAAAIAAATSVPASVAGPTGALLGALMPGARADLVVLEPTLAVAATVVDGVPVHDPRRLLA